MSQKLTGNGLWESSRIIVPEHKEAILEFRVRRNARKKPVIHEDEYEVFSRRLVNSLKNKELVDVEIFGKYNNRVVRGIVTHIDSYKQRIKIENLEGFEWVDMSEVVGVN